MVSAGFDPKSTSYMFEKLQSLSRLSGSNELEFLRSHPLTKNRIADAQSRAQGFENKNIEIHLIMILLGIGQSYIFRSTSTSCNNISKRAYKFI